MKNYDESRQQLREQGWQRADRTDPNGLHEELWHAPEPHRNHPPQGVSYSTAVRLAGIPPAPIPPRQNPRVPYRRKKGLQAKHISTEAVLLAVASEQAAGAYWSILWEIAEKVPATAPDGCEISPDGADKVWLSKIRSLITAGLLNGCGCGCRGDLQVSSAGRKRIACPVCLVAPGKHHTEGCVVEQCRLCYCPVAGTFEVRSVSRISGCNCEEGDLSYDAAVELHGGRVPWTEETEVVGGPSLWMDRE